MRWWHSRTRRQDLRLDLWNDWISAVVFGCAVVVIPVLKPGHWVLWLGLSALCLINAVNGIRLTRRELRGTDPGQ